MNFSMKAPQSLFINNTWVKTSESEDVINPATEEVIGHAPVGNCDLVSAAIGAAREAFDTGVWPRMHAGERKAYLQKLHAAIMARKEDFLEIIVAEAGATTQVAQFQFFMPMLHAQGTLDVMDRDPMSSLAVELNPSPAGGTVLGGGVMVREPVGVVSAITPYNFPHYLNLSKVFQALAAGCTVVLKPSPYTPFEALLLAEAAESAGLPKGIFNVVTGGREVGEILSTDPRVDIVSFTGSDTVGAAIQAQAAPSLKRVLLELGGKSAMIVREDANLDIALRSGLSGFTFHAGQGCALLTRHLVHNSVRQEYVEKISGMAKAVKVGNPIDPTVTMGPLIRAAQRQRTEDYVAIALDEGAKLATGGKRPDALERGFYYEPTLFVDVENSWRIAQEEVFGPVGVVIGFDTDEEAIELANDSQFGLGGAIISADTGRAFEMAREIRTGKVDINAGAGKPLSQAPFGGIKRSGYGREYGVEGIDEYSYIKTIQYRGA